MADRKRQHSGPLIAPQLPLKAGVSKSQGSPSILCSKKPTAGPSGGSGGMEAVRTAFHAQLATVMDSLLAAAVCEIAKIFESSLCEQQAELAQQRQEICSLRVRLERTERRQRARGAEAGDQGGELAPEQGGEGGSQHSLTGPGQSVRRDEACPADKDGELAEGSGGMKEEMVAQEVALVKHEVHATGSWPTQESVAVQTVEGGPDVADHVCPPQAKAKLSHWSQGGRGADQRPLQDPTPSPFLSISQSGHCSPRPDPCLPQSSGEWLPGLDVGEGAMSGAGTLQAGGGAHCSVPVSGSGAAAEQPCFRPGLVSDDNSNEDDGGGGAFVFIDHGAENQTSSAGQVLAECVSRQDPPQDPASVESLWRDRSGRGSASHPRRTASFPSRGPLRPQPNTHSLSLRHANALNQPPAPGGGGGAGRPYTCPYCTKCFTYPSHQRRHLLRHTGIRLHPCQFCDKSFLTPSELTVHTRTHTGERPFACAQCGKRFARSGNLRAHQRDVHMGKRPFACAECGKRFAHRGNLRVHNHRVHQAALLCG